MCVKIPDKEAVLTRNQHPAIRRPRLMKHVRWLIGLIPVLAAAGCGSASGTAVTASHRPAVAEPGQLVPASAVHRLTAIADRAVTLNGGHPVAWATAVVTTHAKALTSATPGDTTPGAKAIVYLVTIKGRFVCGLCSGPPGSHAPTGTYLSLVIDARTFAGTDSGLGPKPPPVPPARFGPVTYLKIHPLALGRVRPAVGSAPQTRRRPSLGPGQPG